MKFGAGLINDRFFVDFFFSFFVISQASRPLSLFHYTVSCRVFVVWSLTDSFVNAIPKSLQDSIEGAK